MPRDDGRDCEPSWLARRTSPGAIIARAAANTSARTIGPRAPLRRGAAAVVSVRSAVGACPAASLLIHQRIAASFVSPLRPPAIARAWNHALGGSVEVAQGRRKPGLCAFLELGGAPSS